MMTRHTPDHYETLRSRPVLHPVVEFSSWLGDRMLGVLDVVDWTASDRETDQVRGELTCTVARTPGMQPAAYDAPTGRNGQTIRARVGLRSGRDRDPAAWADLGHFRIVASTPSRDKVEVRAAGPLHAVEQARFTVDPVLRPAESIRARAAWMVQSLVPVTVDPRLVDRQVPAAEYGGHDRLEAFLSVLEAWPAVAEPDGPGLLIRPPYDDDGDAVDLTYRDGPGGTLIDVAAVGGDEMPPNAIVAANDTGSLQAIAAVDVGPWRYGGPAGYRPEFYSSPLLGTVQQCLNTALARLGREQRLINRVKATIVTDLRPVVGSVVRVVSGQGAGTDVVGRVAEITQKRDRTEIEAAVISGVVDGQRVEGYGLSSTAGLTPVADLGAGRVTVPVGDTGTWSDRLGAWRTDTTNLIVGRDEVDTTAGFAWWGDTPAGLPGTLMAGSVEMLRDDLATGDDTHTLTLTPQLVAGTRRVGTGKPVVLSTANETVSLPQARVGEERRPVVWEIPDDWLAQLQSGAAGGLGFIAIEQAPGTIMATGGRSLTLRLDWRR